MNIDHQALYRPITKWTTRLSAGSFKESIAHALHVAVSEVPGPVHVGLPSDIDGEMLGAGSLVDSITKAPVPSPDPVLLEKAAILIKKAKRPVLAIGLTAARLGLQNEIRQLAGKSNIPVLLTPMAKGLVPETHPLYAGVIFHAQSNLVASVYRNADLVIGIGYDSVEFNYESWMPNVPLIHIDTQPVDIPPEYDVACEITGDLRQSVAYLNSLSLPAYSWDAGQINENKDKVFQALMTKNGSFGPSDAIMILQEVMPEDGIITGDVGAHIHLLGQLWRVNGPNRFIMTNGWSSMGFGIPSAIAARLCRPQSTVVGITGDGGFLMNCGELLTARRLGINVVILVLCDRSLSLIEVKQNWKNVPLYGTGLYEGEYFAADKFLGVPVLTVHDAGGMKEALYTAFSEAGPVIIEAFVDGAGYSNLITRSYK